MPPENDEKRNGLQEKEIIDYIYKDLLYTSDSYFASEQIYPYWETIYTIILVGLIAWYFDKSSDDISVAGVIIILLGLILSLTWLFLVLREEKFSIARTQRMRALEKALEKKIGYEINDLDKSDDDNDRFYLFSLAKLIEKRIKGNSNPLAIWNWRTWTYRKLIPILLCILWIFFLIKWLFAIWCG